MSQSVGATHTATVGEARRRTLLTAALLVAVALIMIAAAVYVVLGEKKIDVSPSLWSAALDLCRAVTGVSGVLVIASVVTERRSGSRGEGTLGTVAAGAFLIAGAVAGLGVVIAITGLGGIALLYAGGAITCQSLASSRASWVTPKAAPPTPSARRNQLAPSTISSADHTSSASRDTSLAAEDVGPRVPQAIAAARTVAISGRLGNWTMGNERGIGGATSLGSDVVSHGFVGRVVDSGRPRG